MDPAKCASCDNLLFKDDGPLCLNCIRIQRKAQASLKSKIAKPKVRRCPPIPNRILRHLSKKSAESLKAYTKEWFASADGPPGVTKTPAYEAMWSELARVFMVCTACTHASQHICRMACWEGESY